MTIRDPHSVDRWWEEAERPDRSGAGRRWDRLAWPAVAVLAFLTFELTADPALALAVGCVKFGWGDFRTAIRLRWLDPDRSRGRACSWFYHALGFWKVSLVALVLTVSIPMAHVVMANGNVPVGKGMLKPFFSAIMLAWCGFVVATMTTNFAILLAWRRGIKVWAGSRFNRAGFVILGALALQPFGLGFVLILVISTRIQGLWFILILWGTLIGIAAAVASLFKVVAKRIVATSREDCWPVPLAFPVP